MCACPEHATLAADNKTCLCSNGNRLTENGVYCDGKFMYIVYVSPMQNLAFFFVESKHSRLLVIKIVNNFLQTLKVAERCSCLRTICIK